MLTSIVDDVQKLALPDPSSIDYKDEDINVVGPSLDAFPSLKQLDTKILAAYAEKLQPHIENVQVWLIGAVIRYIQMSRQSLLSSSINLYILYNY